MGYFTLKKGNLMMFEQYPILGRFFLLHYRGNPEDSGREDWGLRED